MIHDKFCPAQVMVMPYFCCCGLIEAARADEREQAAQRILDLDDEIYSDYWRACIPAAVDAVRKGEHEHFWEKRYGEKTHHCECGAYLKDDNYGSEMA